MSFDRKISAALVFAVAMQIIGGLTWAGAAAERLDRLEQEAILARPAIERLARLEAELEGVRQQLDRIENKLDEVMIPR